MQTSEFTYKKIWALLHCIVISCKKENTFLITWYRFIGHCPHIRSKHNLGHYDYHPTNEGHNKVDPEEPPEECEVGGYHRPEIALYVPDFTLPRDHECRVVRQLSRHLV